MRVGLAAGAVALRLPLRPMKRICCSTSSARPVRGDGECGRALGSQGQRAGQGTIHLDVREGVTLANFENIYDRVLDDAIQIGRTRWPATARKCSRNAAPSMRRRRPS
jgi:hypothetical protein